MRFHRSNYRSSCKSLVRVVGTVHGTIDCERHGAVEVGSMMPVPVPDTATKQRYGRVELATCVGQDGCAAADRTLIAHDRRARRPRTFPAWRPPFGGVGCVHPARLIDPRCLGCLGSPVGRFRPFRPASRATKSKKMPASTPWLRRVRLSSPSLGKPGICMFTGHWGSRKKRILS